MTEVSHHPTCKTANPKILAELTAAVSRVPSLLDVGFLPWVGKNYGRSARFGSPCVLIMGESHYEWCEKCWFDGIKRDRTLTLYCIAERIVCMESPGQVQHWTKIENAFLGAAAQIAERREFWHSVTYYNFLQEIEGLGPRMTVGSASIWGKAQPAFIKLIETLQPNLVVVLGRRLWSALPTGDGLTPIRTQGKLLKRQQYRLSPGRTVVACGVDHPAAGLGATWRLVLMRAIEML